MATTRPMAPWGRDGTRPGRSGLVGTHKKSAVNPHGFTEGLISVQLCCADVFSFPELRIGTYILRRCLCG